MACLKAPGLPPLPDFVLKLDLAIALPGVNLGLCCNLPPIDPPQIPLPPLPPVALLTPVIVAINAAVDAANAALDQIQISCPFD